MVWGRAAVSSAGAATRGRIGHVNVSVTQQVYAHRSDGLDQAMAEKLADLIQSYTDSSEADAARLITDLVTDLVTGGASAAETGLKGPT
jgi:hypothetical protein